ncbi:hypothetical protein [Frankia sp. QA3]|uniref:hypothetical protein n=1 Tax=Frankia sp. QA3 TaxID=710111 RepID=UPI0002F0DEE4|nr:hypothetical protein [Frankia sp. QA3]
MQRRFLDSFRADVGVEQDGASRWWELPADEPYLWTYLTHHLAAARAGCAGGGELDRLPGDLRWAVAQLERSGPAVLDADLARSASAWARRLRHHCAQTAHLFTAVEPSHGLAVTLLSRLHGDEMFAAAVERYRAGAAGVYVFTYRPGHPHLLDPDS